jgi:hypothetical protein
MMTTDRPAKARAAGPHGGSIVDWAHDFRFVAPRTLLGDIVRRWVSFRSTLDQFSMGAKSPTSCSQEMFHVEQFALLSWNVPRGTCAHRSGHGDLEVSAAPKVKGARRSDFSADFALSRCKMTVETSPTRFQIGINAHRAFAYSGPRFPELETDATACRRGNGFVLESK